MPAMNRTLIHTPKTRPILIFWLPPSSRHLSTSSHHSRESQFRRSDFDGQGWTSSYEPGAPTVGPLAQSSKLSAPRLTPSLLKEHLDKFVVGQDKAKKVTSVAIFNHYQRIREIKRQETEAAELKEKERRWEMRERERGSHPVENEFPGHVESVDLNPNTRTPDPEPELGSKPLEEPPSTIIEKSNLLLLGPSGVGKTYILSTLARVLEVPFATVDCSSLTQAGYIGTDIESSIERLLLASNHSIQKCETGIIFFDEVDKLAKPAIMTHGRDVSGEGVQQGLLKMIEGTTVTVSAKSDRSSKSEQNQRGSDRMERSGRDGGVGSQPGKSEQYTIDTSQILFVFAGAFIGLEKIITARLSAGSSIGFGAELRNPSGSTSTSTSISASGSRKQNSVPNPLDSVTPPDLQSYGLIPELLGRIPITVSLSPLSLPQLVSILTEPKNSLVKQYVALFNTYGIHLRFTSASLHAIAGRALDTGKSDGKAGGGKGSMGGIGARGLRSIMENVLGEIMFWGPGSAIRFCLVDEKFVVEQAGSSSGAERGANGGEGEGEEGRSKMPRCWGRGQGRLMEDAWEKEEEMWKAREEERRRKESGEDETEGVGSFERYREVGSSGM